MRWTVSPAASRAGAACAEKGPLLPDTVPPAPGPAAWARSEEHTSELQSQSNLVCRLLLEKKKPVTERRNAVSLRKFRLNQSLGAPAKETPLPHLDIPQCLFVIVCVFVNLFTQLDATALYF